MLAALDVAYQDQFAAVGMVLFKSWDASAPSSVSMVPCRTPAAYTPGAFYRRELPCLLQAFESRGAACTHVLVDGYVHLQEPRRKGLGYHLYEHLAGRVMVIGVAKSPLAVARDFVPVLRGRSSRPLFVSAIGMDRFRAAAFVRTMAGEHRIPAMIKLADCAARQGLAEMC